MLPVPGSQGVYEDNPSLRAFVSPATLGSVAASSPVTSPSHITELFPPSSPFLPPATLGSPSSPFDIEHPFIARTVGYSSSLPYNATTSTFPDATVEAPSPSTMMEMNAGQSTPLPIPSAGHSSLPPYTVTTFSPSSFESAPLLSPPVMFEANVGQISLLPPQLFHLVNIFFEKLGSQFSFFDKDAVMAQVKQSTISPLLANSIAGIAARYVLYFFQKPAADR
jgi:hypothetical protein